MIVVEKVLGRLKPGEARRVEYVLLGWEDRLRARQRVVSDAGTELGVALPTGHPLHDGDVLYEDAQRVVAVRAAAEDVLVLYPGSFEECGRVAYQVGNHHAPVSVQESRILTPYDSVLEAFFRRMGVRSERAREPFTHEFGSFHSHHYHH